MKLDLHLHSDVSDGRVAPQDVVRAAIAGGLDAVALTDHDTAAGVPAAKEAALGSRLFVIPGLEISTRFHDHDLHILGYWIDPAHPAILDHQRVAQRRREDRMHRMVAKLNDMGIPIRFEQVLVAAGPSAEVLGRPHLARALLAAGHTRYYTEAFDRYLYDGGPAFVSEAFPTVAEAIERIHAAGGLAVWAHPPRDVFEAEIRRFAGQGLDGVECLRPLLPPAESLYLEAGANAHRLLVTGGSDWHGPGQAELGTFTVRPHEIRGFLDADHSAPLREWRRATLAENTPTPPARGG
jgi:3',5'-nucleoside bisphosphate phosphatase